VGRIRWGNKLSVRNSKTKKEIRAATKLKTWEKEKSNHWRRKSQVSDGDERGKTSMKKYPQKKTNKKEGGREKRSQDVSPPLTGHYKKIDGFFIGKKTPGP